MWVTAYAQDTSAVLQTELMWFCDANMLAAKTNFSALAMAIKDVGARGAALASARSQSNDAGTPAAPLSVADVLRDPPDSGPPIDEMDRYCIHISVMHDACKIHA